MNIQNKGYGSLHLDGEDITNERVRLLTEDNIKKERLMREMRIDIEILKQNVERLNAYVSLLNERFVLKTTHANGATTIYNF